MAITLHIIFGLVAFVGSVLSATAFGEKFQSLTTMQKVAIALSYVGIMGSTILGISSRFESPVWLIVVSVAIILFTVYSVFKPARQVRKITTKKLN